MTLNLRLNMITHVIVLLYTIYISFKHIIGVNDKVFKKLFAYSAFVSAIWLVLHRETYLPFLGYCAIPPSIFKDKLTSPDANIEVVLDIDAKEGTRLIYWAAKPNNNVQNNPKLAYGDYSNAGITAVSNGQAKVRIYCPAKYKVGPGYTLNRHIHYRMIEENGLVSPVYTKNISC